jgi:hypothetical protein
MKDLYEWIYDMCLWQTATDALGLDEEASKQGKVSTEVETPVVGQPNANNGLLRGGSEGKNEHS